MNFVLARCAMVRSTSLLLLLLLLLVLTSFALGADTADTAEREEPEVDGESQKSKRLSVLIISSFFSGHQIPLLAVGEELVRRGHNVSFFTTEISGSNLIPDVPRQLGMAFISAGPDPRTKLQYEEAFYQCMGRSLLSQMYEVLTLAQDHLLQLRVAADKLNISEWDIVVADVQAYNLIRHIHLKWGVKIIISIAVASDYPSMEPPWPSPSTYALGSTENMSFFQRFLTVVVYRPLLTSSLGIYLLKYLLAGNDDVLWKSISQDPYFAYSVDTLHPSLIYTAYGVEYAKLRLPSVHYVGPVLRHDPKPLEADLEEWLKGKEEGRVIYISMGTTALITKSMAEGLIKGVEATDYSVMWSLRETNQYILEGLDVDRSRFYITSWVSQVAALQHPAIGLTILHCGTGGVHEALYFQVPIICIPFWYDQFSWANKVEGQGVGLHLHAEDVSVETVRESIREIERGGYREKAMRVSRILRQAGGSEKAAEWVEFYAEVGYDHLIPAYAKYGWSWVQYYNVDAYGVILGVTLTVLLVVGWLTWRVCHCLLAVCCCKQRAKSKVD